MAGALLRPRRRAQDGGADVPGEADATAYLATLESDVVRGVWRAPETSRVLVRTSAARWIETNPRLKRSTRALYEDLLRMWINPFIGDLRLSDISPANVREWHAEISSQTGKTRVAQAYRLLRAVLNTSVADGVLASNPCRIDGAGASKARPVQLLPIPVIEATEAHLPPRYRTLLQLFVWSGMRFGEAAELRRKHVDLAIGAVTIERRLYRIPTTGVHDVDAPKSDAGRRVVHLPPQVVASLRQHMETFVGPGPDARVFATSVGNPINSGNWNQTLRRALEKAGHPAVRPHDLRHLGSTLAATAGASTAELMRRMGHSTSRAAMIYQHATNDRDAAIADALGRLAGGGASE